MAEIQKAPNTTIPNKNEMQPSFAYLSPRLYVRENIRDELPPKADGLLQFFFLFSNKIIKGNERARILLNWPRKMISSEVECMSF